MTSRNVDFPATITPACPRLKRLALCLAASLPALATAQIRTDGSVGAAQTLVGPNVQIPQSLGRLAGSNLFHSFAEFSIGSGESATFTTSSAGIANVISRVSGGNASQINGKLALTAASGNPNLFLINPAGVVFGAGAVLNVPGSFNVTTADHIRFADGLFHADPAKTSSYSSAAPQGFGFLGTMRGAISIRDGAIINTRAGKRIHIAAGDVNILDGGAVVTSNGGEITIVAVGSEGRDRGNILIANGGQVYSTTDGRADAGKVTLAAENLIVTAGGRNNPGDVVTGVIGEAKSGSSGASADIDIVASGRLELNDGARIATTASGSGGAGAISVRGREISVDGKKNGSFTGIASLVEREGSGNAGKVDVVAERLTLLNGAILSTSLGEGIGGRIAVDANEIRIDGNGRAAAISGDAFEGGVGNAGSIEVTARDFLDIRNGGKISSTTRSAGSAGAISIRAADLNIDGQEARIFTGIASQAGTMSSGTAGSVQVEAGNVSLKNRAEISASTYSSGNGGNINIRSGGVSIDTQASINSGTSGGRGHAGNVSINADSIAVTRGAQVTSATLSAGNAGRVAINGRLITVDGRDGYALVSSDANAGSTGNAGSVEIIARDKFQVLAGGVISSATFESGNAGSVTVIAGEVEVNGKGSGRATVITSEASTGSTGNAGNVGVYARDRLSVIGGGQVRSATAASGSAGTVMLNAGSLLVDGQKSAINALATFDSSGQTGSVTVAVRDGITVTNGGTISIENGATVGNSKRIVPTQLTVSAPSIALHSQGKISAASVGNVAASNLDIRFTDQLTLDSASIATSANQGNGGAISIAGSGAMALTRSRVTTSVAGQMGNGGNIDLKVGGLALNTGFIQANTAAANASGGDVAIDVQLLVPSGNSLFVGGSTPYEFNGGVFGFNVIQAAAPTGVSGAVRITTPAIDVSGSLGGLKAQTIDAGGLGRNPCQASGGSSLAQTGRGGLPPSNREALTVDAATSGPVAMRTPPEPLLLVQAGAGCRQ